MDTDYTGPEYMIEATSSDGVTVWIYVHPDDTEQDIMASATDRAWADGHGDVVADHWTWQAA